jgi:beta-glucosidase
VVFGARRLDQPGERIALCPLLRPGHARLWRPDRLLPSRSTNPTCFLEIVLPPQVWDIQKVTLEGAAKQLGVKRFVSANVAGFDDLPELQAGLAAAHKAGKAAIEAAAPACRWACHFRLSTIRPWARIQSATRCAPISMACGSNWPNRTISWAFKIERALWGDKGKLPAPADAIRNSSGAEVYAPSLARSVRCIYGAARVPVMVSRTWRRDR